MEISSRKNNNDEYVIKISGAVDTEAAEEMKMELTRIIRLNPSKVSMDLSLVPSIGSSGIGKILLLFKELDKNNATFEIKGIHDNLYNIFKSIKLDQLFPITKR